MATSGPANRLLNKEPGDAVAYLFCVCTGWKRWQELMKPAKPDEQKQAQQTKIYEAMGFTVSPANPDAYPAYALELKTEKYQGTEYVLGLKPQDHQLEVFHMNRGTGDPLAASVVLFEQYKAAAQKAQLQPPWQLNDMPNINVFSDLGAKVVVVIWQEQVQVQEHFPPEPAKVESVGSELAKLKSAVDTADSQVDKALNSRQRGKLLHQLLEKSGAFALLNPLPEDLCDFLALLGIENASPIVWFIKDYGKVLNITGLKSISISNNGQNITYHFRH